MRRLHLMFIMALIFLFTAVSASAAVRGSPFEDGQNSVMLSEANFTLSAIPDLLSADSGGSTSNLASTGVMCNVTISCLQQTQHRADVELTAANVDIAIQNAIITSTAAASNDNDIGIFTFSPSLDASQVNLFTNGNLTENTRLCMNDYSGKSVESSRRCQTKMLGASRLDGEANMIRSTRNGSNNGVLQQITSTVHGDTSGGVSQSWFHRKI